MNALLEWLIKTKKELAMVLTSDAITELERVISFVEDFIANENIPDPPEIAMARLQGKVEAYEKILANR